MDYPKLERQPVTLVLAEFRHSPVLAIDKHIPAIQDSLREDFPEFRQHQGHQISFSSGRPEVQTLDTSWEFLTEDLKTRIRVEAQRTVVVTLAYNRFPNFQKTCDQALSVVHSVVNLRLLERVGLRYNDTIVPERSRRLEDYLVPSVLPSSELLSLGQEIHHRTETKLKTEHGVLTVRSLVGSHGLPASPDLLQTFEPTDFQTIEPGVNSGVLDFDHAWEAGNERVRFSVAEATGRLNKLHLTSREAFWRLATPEATQKYWRKS